jgi:DNA-binding transcriptional ArsR family regulator
MEQRGHVLTPASLKALAHPVRVRLLGLLRTEGPATATALAARLGESSGTTSYHLRQLAAADFVVEDAGRGNARERWWRTAQDFTRLEPAGLPDDPETQRAVDVFLGALAGAYIRRLEQWLRTSRTWPKRWQAAATRSDLWLSLTAAELERLNAEVEELVTGYLRAPRKGDQQVVFQIQSFPVRGEP